MRRFPRGRGGRRTLAGRVLAEVLSLVASEETGRLDLRSWASGELLVEANNALHADGIRGRTDGLSIVMNRQHICIFVLYPPSYRASLPLIT